jgi:hypothetical protein
VCGPHGGVLRCELGASHSGLFQCVNGLVQSTCCFPPPSEAGLDAIPQLRPSQLHFQAQSGEHLYIGTPPRSTLSTHLPCLPPVLKAQVLTHHHPHSTGRQLLLQSGTPKTSGHSVLQCDFPLTTFFSLAPSLVSLSLLRTPNC